METKKIDVIKKSDISYEIFEMIFKELQFDRDPIFTIVVNKKILEFISESVGNDVKFHDENQQLLFEIDKIINDMKSEYLIIEE